MNKKQTVIDSKITLIESPEKLTDVSCESKECYPKRKKEQVPSEKSVEKFKENVKEITKVHEMHKVESQKDIENVKSSEIFTKTQVSKIHDTYKAKSTIYIKDDQSDTSSKASEEIYSVEYIKSTKDASKTKKTPVIEQVVSIFF